MPFFGTFAGLPWNKAPGNKKLSMKRLEFDLRKIKKLVKNVLKGTFAFFFWQILNMFETGVQLNFNILNKTKQVWTEMHCEFNKYD